MNRPENKEEFKQFINEAMEFLGVDDRFVANTFGTSLGTITRWREGISCPHPFMYPAVHERLMAMAKEKEFDESEDLSDAPTPWPTNDETKTPGIDY